MYFPVLRSKQFELIALRELVASDVELSGYVCPIIEPVRKKLKPLLTAVGALNERGVAPLILVNPTIGDFSFDYSSLLNELNSSDIKFLPCVAIKDSSDDEAKALIAELGVEFSIFVTGGVDNGILDISRDARYTIVDESTPPPAVRKLTNVVLVGDFFEKQLRNLDYQDESSFSYLHVSFQDTKTVCGFGDYTILPKDFSEGGGPAYVVTVHVSYINQDRFDEMYVKHYSSYNDNSPTDPGGKFLDALGKLIHDKNEKPPIFIASEGMREFEELHEKQHFPGLGQVKKISIKHHIETVCDYLVENAGG